MTSIDKNSLWGRLNIQKRQLCVKGILALAHLHFPRSSWNPYQKVRIKKSFQVCIFYLTYRLQSGLLLSTLQKEDPMENKIPDGLLNLYESFLSAQLRVVRQLKTPKPGKPKRETKQGISNIDTALDILRQAHQPLHVSQILEQVEAKYKITLDRESLVSALVKKVHRHHGGVRTAPNTFEGK
jgi:hypothetical protein